MSGANTVFLERWHLQQTVFVTYLFSSVYCLLGKILVVSKYTSTHDNSLLRQEILAECENHRLYRVNHPAQMYETV